MNILKKMAHYQSLFLLFHINDTVNSEERFAIWTFVLYGQCFKGSVNYDYKFLVITTPELLITIKQPL